MPGMLGDGPVKETVLYCKRSPYQEIKLTQLEGGQFACYLDDCIQFVSGHDDIVYHGTLASMAANMLKGQPGKALILGGGDGLAARNLLQYPNIKEIRMVELDPEMVAFSANHPVMRQLNGDSFRNPRLKLEVGDARKWVKHSPEGGFQLAIVDFPDPLGPEMADLFSAPFYNQVMAHMDQSRPTFAVQSSMAFSDVEEHVEGELSKVTGTGSIPVRFIGEWMMDGTIVYSGRGVDPRLTRLPDQYVAKEALGFRGREVLGEMF